MKSAVDFIASLQYKTMEEGGRKTPAKSGYRPTVVFPFSEMQTSGEQTFINRAFVMPGDSVDAEIRILAVDHFSGCLYEGLTFDFKEGDRLIGTGVIKQVINDKLRNKDGLHIPVHEEPKNDITI
ncbi:hypothetical protein IM797_28235, partial [Pedobacter sp. MC2016-24]|nr:hypothetical protein [Pedobacter sp. MC2016-24]